MTHDHLTQAEDHPALTSDLLVDDVAAWRLRRLVETGFPQALARLLATTPGYDLHALLGLVDRGCPPHLAARILAPLGVVTDEPRDSA